MVCYYDTRFPGYYIESPCLIQPTLQRLTQQTYQFQQKFALPQQGQAIPAFLSPRIHYETTCYKPHYNHHPTYVQSHKKPMNLQPGQECDIQWGSYVRSDSINCALPPDGVQKHYPQAVNSNSYLHAPRQHSHWHSTGCAAEQRPLLPRIHLHKFNYHPDLYARAPSLRQVTEQLPFVQHESDRSVTVPLEVFSAGNLRVEDILPFVDLPCARRTASTGHNEFGLPAPSPRRRDVSRAVYLHVYDLDRFSATLNRFTRNINTGVFHVGVEVYGTEYSFGRSDHGSGIFLHEPTSNGAHIYRESVSMGFTRLSVSDVDGLVRRLQNVWIGDKYHLIRKNCISFAEEFCYFLGVSRLPEWVNSLALFLRSPADKWNAGVEKFQNSSLSLAPFFEKLRCRKMGEASDDSFYDGEEEISMYRSG